MGITIYVVVFVKEKQYLGNGLVYIGDNEGRAKELHEKYPDTVVYEFAAKDMTIYDFSWKIQK